MNRHACPDRDTILLVDDDEIFREEFIECFPDYRFFEAAGGREALAILKKPNEVDLVIMDVRMPEMDGLSLLEKIRVISPEAACIIVTGYGSKETVLKALRGKADDYIEKPFNVEQTRTVIENVLTGRKERYDNGSAGPESRIEHVKRFLARNISKKMSLKTAAAAVALSPKYLSRFFRKYGGSGFNEYKLRLKMTEAQNLLANTGYSVDQISCRLGYKNTESFIRLFRKSFKRTPAAYRRLLRRRPATPDKSAGSSGPAKKRGPSRRRPRRKI